MGGWMDGKMEMGNGKWEMGNGKRRREEEKRKRRTGGELLTFFPFFFFFFVYGFGCQDSKGGKEEKTKRNETRQRYPDGISFYERSQSDFYADG